MEDSGGTRRGPDRSYSISLRMGEVFMDSHARETRQVRLIAVGNRINLKAAVSEATFAAELERIVGLAVPHLAANRPNLVALGEVLGLPLALAGKRGSLPRRMHNASVDIIMLALASTTRY